MHPRRSHVQEFKLRQLDSSICFLKTFRHSPERLLRFCWITVSCLPKVPFYFIFYICCIRQWVRKLHNPFWVCVCFFLQPTNAAGEPTWRHAEADPPQLHRHHRLRPGAHGPVHYTPPFLPERLPQRFGERSRSPEANHGERWSWAPGGRAPQTGPDHLHSHVPTAFPACAAHCILHQLPAEELLLCLHAI